MSRSDFTRIERRDSGNSGDAGLLSGGALQGSCARPSAAPGLVEHFFRREYGRLVALLARKVGVRHIDVVEDAVQRVASEGLTWLWPDLDRLADAENGEVAAQACEALERLREELVGSPP